MLKTMLRSRFALSPIAALLVALPLACAHAGLFDDEEARAQIVQLRNLVAEQQRLIDQRLGELESQARNRSIIDLFNQVETLRAEMARLRGQLELLQNEIENSQKRQRDLYVDLDGRMRKLEAQQEAARQAQQTPPAQPSPIVQAPVLPDPVRGAPPAVAGQSQAPLQVVPVTDAVQEQRVYDQGLDHFRAGRFGEAVTAFQIFIRNYPRSPLASSAQYWIGNSLYAARDFVVRSLRSASYSHNGLIPTRRRMRYSIFRLHLQNSATSRDRGRRYKKSIANIQPQRPPPKRGSG